MTNNYYVDDCVQTRSDVRQKQNYLLVSEAKSQLRQYGFYLRDYRQSQLLMQGRRSGLINAITAWSLFLKLCSDFTGHTFHRQNPDSGHRVEGLPSVMPG